MLPGQHLSCKSTSNAGEVGLHKDARPNSWPCSEGSRKLESHPGAFNIMAFSVVLAVARCVACLCVGCVLFVASIEVDCVG